MTFSTTGEYLQGIMMDLFTSGEFKTFEQMVLDSGMDDRHQNLCFRLKFELTGDTRNGGDLNLEVLPESPENFGEILYTAIRTSIGSASDVWQENTFVELINNVKSLSDGYGKTLSNVRVLLKYFTPDEIIEICKLQILNDEGYDVVPMRETLHGQRATSAVLCQDGTFIEVGFENHRYALPLLEKLGYIKSVDAKRGTDDGVHISSNAVSGGLGFEFSRGDGRNMSFEQINALWQNSDIIDRFYLSSVSTTGTVGENAFIAWIDKNNNGGKMGGLEFLKANMSKELEKYKIKVADVSHDPEDFSDDKVFIRTSPKKSLPGLLTSYLVENNEFGVAEGVSRILLDFEKVKNVRTENEIDYFFQRHIKGINGVAHLDYMKGMNSGDYQHQTKDFRYQASSNQGDVVSGVVSDAKIEALNVEALHAFMKHLVKKIRKKIQIEFVEDESGQLYIVQVRIIEGGNQTLQPSNKDLSGADVLGHTFVSSWRNPESYAVDIDDVLIIDSEAKPDELVGKKLLIVRENVDFSHILALSAALSIPSIYGLDKKDFDFSDAKRITVNTQTVTGIIKIEK